MFAGHTSYIYGRRTLPRSPAYPGLGTKPFFCFFTLSFLVRLFCFRFHASSPLLYHSCRFHFAPPPCSISLALFVFALCRFTSLASSVLLFVSWLIVPDLSASFFLGHSVCLYPLFSLCSPVFYFFYFVFGLLSSVFFRRLCYLFEFGVVLWITVPISRLECFADYCASVGKPSCTFRAQSTAAPHTTAATLAESLRQWRLLSHFSGKNHYLACTRFCWNVKLASRSHNGRVLVSG